MYTSVHYVTELIFQKSFVWRVHTAMNLAAVLREKAELERRFAEIQGLLGGWEAELKVAPAPKRDRKKYGLAATARRGRREVSQMAAKARITEVLSRAPEERKFETPRWVDREFVQREGRGMVGDSKSLPGLTKSDCHGR